MTFQVLAPALGESVVGATVAKWLKQEGESVSTGDALVSLETDKVDLEVTATQTGVLSKIEKQTGEDVQAGDVLAVISAVGEEGATPASTLPPRTPDAPEPSTAEPERGERVTPVAKRMAVEKGVDLTEVAGAGPGGRVTKRDVESYVQERETAPSAAPASAPVAKPAPVAGNGPTTVPDVRGEERIRMSRRRRTIAERLVAAQQTAAMLTTFNEVDMSAVMDLRQRRRDDFKTREGWGWASCPSLSRRPWARSSCFPNSTPQSKATRLS